MSDAQPPAGLPFVLLPIQPHTDDGEVGAGSDACDHVGGNTFPLPMVLLTQGAELETPTG